MEHGPAQGVSRWHVWIGEHAQVGQVAPNEECTVLVPLCVQPPRVAEHGPAQDDMVGHGGLGTGLCSDMQKQCGHAPVCQVVVV